jgi:hypothetical protein
MPPYHAVLIDAAGTLLSPSENVADVYLKYAQKHGCTLSTQELLEGFRRYVTQAFVCLAWQALVGVHANAPTSHSILASC